jgi:hypothetical protein
MLPMKIQIVVVNLFGYIQIELFYFFRVAGKSQNSKKSKNHILNISGCEICFQKHMIFM